MVFVLDLNKQPLSPCHQAVARRLLKQGKAAIFKKYPFTIILKEQKQYNDKQEYRLKIDYGSKHTGLAILNKDNVLWLGQIEHRTRKEKWIPPSLESRVQNIQTGDMVKAIVPKGKYKGVWFGEVACRKNGSFDIKNKEGKRIAQGISYKCFTVQQRFNGYKYNIEGR